MARNASKSQDQREEKISEKKEGKSKSVGRKNVKNKEEVKEAPAKSRRMGTAKKESPSTKRSAPAKSRKKQLYILYPYTIKEIVFHRSVRNIGLKDG